VDILAGGLSDVLQSLSEHYPLLSAAVVLVGVLVWGFVWVHGRGARTATQAWQGSFDKMEATWKTRVEDLTDENQRLREKWHRKNP
jgi:hypothetical protein